MGYFREELEVAKANKSSQKGHIQILFSTYSRSLVVFTPKLKTLLCIQPQYSYLSANISNVHLIYLVLCFGGGGKYISGCG